MTRYDTWENNYESFNNINISCIHKFNLVRFKTSFHHLPAITIYPNEYTLLPKHTHSLSFHSVVRTYFSHFSCQGEPGGTSRRETTGMGKAVASAINQIPAIINLA